MPEQPGALTEYNRDLEAKPYQPDLVSKVVPRAGHCDEFKLGRTASFFYSDDTLRL